jgi:hypothetical protein
LAKFLTNYGTSACIETIISDAQKTLVLVSPYWKFPETLYQRLLQADRRGVRTTIVYGKTDLAPAQRELMDALENLELFFCEPLHAKCYANEKLLVVSSLNLHEFSERHNREMSVSLEPGEEAFDAAMREVGAIVAASVREVRTHQSRAVLAQDASRAAVSPAPPVTRTGRDGFCVRCGDPLPFNPGKPFCYECWDAWAFGDGTDHLRDFCHRCGRRYATSQERPLCPSCFRAL